MSTYLIADHYLFRSFPLSGTREMLHVLVAVSTKVANFLAIQKHNVVSTTCRSRAFSYKISEDHSPG
jgi:hypothetical protein